jgi:hypothetical protein
MQVNVGIYHFFDVAQRRVEFLILVFSGETMDYTTFVFQKFPSSQQALKHSPIFSKAWS